MLKLTNVTKVFEMGDYSVRALRGVTLAFRESEFVSVIGASGCGKSTLLNIIGGLDRYTTGDLVIGNTSTKDFKSEQWDAYRNATIGFVFQNYNLIPHLTVLENVELALSLSGVDKAARRKMAIAALERVGMGDELKKKPSQISGGQMQRVAIARALVNNPKIVLADEPTGALDSKLSVQVMELLKEVAKDRLVIMVTHNNELADTYSTRIVKLRDGLVESDTDPYEWEPEIVHLDAEKASSDEKKEKKAAFKKGEKEKAAADAQNSDAKAMNALGIKQRGQKSPFKATSMKATTAFSLSLKNLLTKKRRTFLTSFAGSVGIISLALVLAMSNGFNVMLESMQANILATVPIGMYEFSIDYSIFTDMIENLTVGSGTTTEHPDEDVIYFDDSSSMSLSGAGMTSFIEVFLNSSSSSIGHNTINTEYVEYLKKMEEEHPDWVNSINYFYGTKMNILAKSLDENGNTVYLDVSPLPQITDAFSIAGQVLGSNGQEPLNWFQLAGGQEFVENSYERIGGHYPQNANEIILVVNGENKIHPSALGSFGFDVYKRDGGNAIKQDGDKEAYEYKDSIKFDDLLGYELKLAYNDTYYESFENDDGELKYRPKNNDDKKLYGAKDPTLTVDETLWTDAEETLTVVGIYRLKDGASGFVGNALCYTPELAEKVLNNARTSEVTEAQNALLAANPDTSKCVVEEDKFFGESLGKDAKSLQDLIFASMDLGIGTGMERSTKLRALAADGYDVPAFITVYPSGFEAKTLITEHLDAWNEKNDELGIDEEVQYFDVSEMFIGNMRMIVDLMTTVLIAVASISLIVSCIMIAIITSNSVVERTREIGILRSLGARKRDISRVFDAETAIIGFVSGVLGIVIAYILIPPINALLGTAMGMGLLNLNPLHALLLVILSLGLTVLSGLVPSQAAARKNVVDALRIE